MGFEQIDEAIKAGEAAENADFAAAADINPLKIAKRPIYIDCHLGQAFLSSTTTAEDGVFPGLRFPDASASYMIIQAAAPRAEVSPGEAAILHIIWKTTPTTGNVRFVVDIKPAISGSANLSSAVQRSIIQAANASADALSRAKVLFPPAIFANSQLIGIKIARDGTNSLDTIGSDVEVHCVYLEIQGRC